jgi:hypothetical protein
LELVPLSSLQSRQLCRNDCSLKEERERKKEHGDMTLLDDHSYDDGHDHSQKICDGFDDYKDCGFKVVLSGDQGSLAVENSEVFVN